MGILYIVGMVISCFFARRKYWPKVLEFKDRESYVVSFESIYFWIIVAHTVGYAITVPIEILWYLLIKFESKFLTKKEKKDEESI